MDRQDGTAAARDLARLQELYGYGVLDTAPEQTFDDVAHLAALVCGAPTALVSLVDKDRQWFKARVGFAPTQTDLDSSVCRFVLDESDILIIPDLSADPRTRGGPLVTGPLAIRFYAGAPLRTAAGHVLGSLCVIDVEPRPGGLTWAQGEALRRLAAQVVELLTLRRALRQRDAALAEEQAARREREALRLAQAAIAGADGDPEGVFDALASAALAAVPAADGAAVQVLEGDELVYRHVRGSSEARRDLRTPLEGSLAGACVRSRASVTVGDALADTRVSRAHVERIGLRSALCAPVFRGEAVVGALELQSAAPFAFSLRDQELAILFAGLATTGFAMARETLTTRELRASEERRRMAAEVGGVGVWDWDVTHDRISLDARCRAILGVSASGPSAVAGTRELRHPDDRDRVDRALARLTAGEDGELHETYRVAVGGGWRHVESRARAVAAGEAGAVRIVGALRDITDEVEAAARQDVVNREMGHRLKNTLAMVQAVAAQTLRGAADRQALDTFDRRLMALGRAHDVLLRSSWESADLAELVRGVLDMSGPGDRWSADGPSFRLGARAVLSTSMLLHELATNASKYGALSTPDGRVAVTWAVEEEGGTAELVLGWREAGGPPAEPPQRRGFGSRLLRLGLVGAGGADLRYEAAGFSAVFRATLEEVGAA